MTSCPPHATLPDVARLSRLIVRVIGLNPGPFTLQGTNTYLIGAGKARLLVDAGEGAPGYLDLLTQTLRDEGAERVSDVLITHYHKDHTEGLREIAAAFGPALRVWKVQPGYAGEYGPSFGADLASVGVSDVRALSDGDVVRTENGDAQVRVVATPGHTPDHACFVLEAGDEAERAVFTGDCVLGGSSAVFENLADYMRSLHTLARLTALQKPGGAGVRGDGRAARRLSRGSRVATAGGWRVVAVAVRALGAQRL